VGRQDAHPAATVRRRTQGNGPVLLPDHARPIRYQDWGVTYTTAAQFSSTLNRCYFHFSIDISDAYHLSLWAGCGGELRPVQTLGIRGIRGIRSTLRPVQTSVQRPD
jgi:hypothetical protein